MPADDLMDHGKQITRKTVRQQLESSNCVSKKKAAFTQLYMRSAFSKKRQAQFNTPLPLCQFCFLHFLNKIERLPEQKFAVSALGKAQPLARFWARGWPVHTVSSRNGRYSINFCTAGIKCSAFFIAKPTGRKYGSRRGRISML